MTTYIMPCVDTYYISTEREPKRLVPIATNNHVATNTYTSSNERIVQHTDTATELVWKTDKSSFISPIIPPAHSLTELPTLWKGLLNISTLSLPDFDGKMKCADVICSNFVNSKCAQKISVKFENAGVIPKCHFQDGTSNIRVLLLSYPGSGNTWIRQLIERSSGVCTGKLVPTL